MEDYWYIPFSNGKWNVPTSMCGYVAICIRKIPRNALLSTGIANNNNNKHATTIKTLLTSSTVSSGVMSFPAPVHSVSQSVIQHLF